MKRLMLALIVSMPILSGCASFKDAGIGVSYEDQKLCLDTSLIQAALFAPGSFLMDWGEKVPFLGKGIEELRKSLAGEAEEEASDVE